ncbi:hypothetical protein R3W88_004607 [Solanum pinnatisectum]|uniref:B-like cyclin n=1 Tax=Solanum pinnatisectum TaxID=50273 RepID=A0AAV9K9X1_9SOLN|nr:hypothetical protein R3W88_004607 [Solanum pinnatisectum]
MEQQSEISDNMRGVLIDWIIEVHDKFELKEETLFLTVNLLDRFLEKQVVAKNKLQVVGLVAFLIAGKYEEIAPSFMLFVVIIYIYQLEELSFFLIELCLVEYEMLKYPPSFMAAAAIYTAHCTLYGVKEWSRTCEWHTEDSLIVKLIVSYHEKAKTGGLIRVHNKYNTSKFAYVAKVEPPYFLVQHS